MKLAPEVALARMQMAIAETPYCHLHLALTVCGCGRSAVGYRPPAGGLDDDEKAALERAGQIVFGCPSLRGDWDRPPDQCRCVDLYDYEAVEA